MQAIHSAITDKVFYVFVPENQSNIKAKQTRQSYLGGQYFDSAKQIQLEDINRRTY